VTAHGAGYDRAMPSLSRDAEIGSTVHTDVPPRLDALGWSRWHQRVVIALGITWILDGLEASLIANLGSTLKQSSALGLTDTEVGFANTVYLVGQVVGALVFGHLTDRLGRKRLFLVTIALYLVATALSGLAPNYAVFVVLRAFAGAGIGGEYSAINSAIDELVPARVRGHVDLAINGTYWIGVAAGALLTLVLVNPNIVPPWIGWRLSFGLGAVLGISILVVRRDVPESPRWLLMHGYIGAANDTMKHIETRVGAPAGEFKPVAIRVFGPTNMAHLVHTLIRRFPRRTILGASLMLAQAFFYNAIFFSSAQILQKFHGVAADRVGLYMLPFAAGNFLGPVLLGRYFDRWGRRIMIPLTYALSGVLLTITGWMFVEGWLDATTQTLCWSVVFFVASAAASSAYLTVSELFPVELRGMAIAVFYAFGTLMGAAAPTVFGKMIQSGDPSELFQGYLLASALMIGAAVIGRVFGVDAEGKSLEALSEH
jgi:MFS family permease